MSLNHDPQLILVTPTYARPDRLLYLRRCSKIFEKVPNLIWLVVEDASETDEEVERMLKSSGVQFRYWAIGPTMDKGHLQRESAFNFIVREGLKGIIYNADDDNYYELHLFDELRQVKKLGILPVGNLGPNGIEGPIVRNNKITGWDAGWSQRAFPVDMAGFAFSSEILDYLTKPYWDHTGIGGESEFISKIANQWSNLEVLCTDATKCCVWHNHPLES